MGDWQDCNDSRPVLVAFHRQHDYTWPILATFVTPGLVLAMPEVAIADDEARFGAGDRSHGARLFWVEQAVEVGVPGVHVHVGEGLGLLRG